MTEQLEFEWTSGYPPRSAPRTPPRLSEDPISPAPPNVAPMHSEEAEPHEDTKTPGNRREIQQSAEALRQWLMARTGKPIVLHITNNSSTMMSVRPHRNGCSTRVSVHYMFLTAPEEVKEALAVWIKKPRTKAAGALLNRFIRERTHQIRPARPRHITRCTKGRHFDLQALFDEINRQYFENAITEVITWGNMPKQRCRPRSMRFGSHSPQQHVIRIHPLLDQPFVPEYFVRYIVYHEMLHAHLGVGEHPSGRRSIHSRRFKQKEKAFPEYERATAWLEDRKHMDELWRMRRR